MEIYTGKSMLSPKSANASLDGFDVHDDWEVVVAPPEPLEMATEFRSTWLNSSVESLKEHDLWERYLELLPASHRTTMDKQMAGCWLPMELAFTHYKACERLSLPRKQLELVGSAVGEKSGGILASVLWKGAKGLGVSPWVALKALPRIWSRVWKGGGAVLYHCGPTEAIVDFVGWPIARYEYVRYSTKGAIQVFVRKFSDNATGSEITHSNASVRWRFSWE